jgi:hypothetical protein
MSRFKLKSDESQEVEILKDQIEEIVPDADFRFSLVILKNGEKHFVCGSGIEIEKILEEE